MMFIGMIRKATDKRFIRIAEKVLVIAPAIIIAKEIVSINDAIATAEVARAAPVTIQEQPIIIRYLFEPAVLVKPAKTVTAQIINPLTSFILITGAITAQFIGMIQIIPDRIFIKPVVLIKLAKPVTA